MEPVQSSSYHELMWSRRYGQVRKVEIGGSMEGVDVHPCPALVGQQQPVVIVQWQLNEVELMDLAKGGTLWLTTWGGLPIHTIEVIPKEAPSGPA